MSFDEIDLQWFAAEDEGRTEDATETRLRREREEGRVAKSQELTSAIVMIMCVVALIVAAPHYLRMCEQILVYYFLLQFFQIQISFFHFFQQLQ